MKVRARAADDLRLNSDDLRVKELKSFLADRSLPPTRSTGGAHRPASFEGGQLAGILDVDKLLHSSPKQDPEATLAACNVKAFLMRWSRQQYRAGSKLAVF
mmetsp:Transcript_147889/g.474791  ORF Transcript_147889/g.474791 Transcript_147889/m.474791 type:complete len:101 (-) Transcript_147889:338-640(-)